jgi:hypothetical protein
MTSAGRSSHCIKTRFAISVAKIIITAITFIINIRYSMDHLQHVLAQTAAVCYNASSTQPCVHTLAR